MRSWRGVGATVGLTRVPRDVDFRTRLTRGATLSCLAPLGCVGHLPSSLDHPILFWPIAGVNATPTSVGDVRCTYSLIMDP